MNEAVQSLRSQYLDQIVERLMDYKREATVEKKFIPIQQVAAPDGDGKVKFQPCLGEYSFAAANAEMLLARSREDGVLKVYRSDGQRLVEHQLAAGEITAIWFGVTNGWCDTDGNILLLGGPGVEVALLRA